MSQMHKRFTDDQIKTFLERYVRHELPGQVIQEALGIGKTRFFALVKIYQADPERFSIQYKRTAAPRTIPAEAEGNILKELAVEKEMIGNPDVPLRSYNYSYIQTLLHSRYGQKVSLPTIIGRAKKHGFYLRKPHRSAHDRDVLTRYAGELIQHDSSQHLFSPPAREKWYLITSLDDYSRFILYAVLVKKETSWTHIQALQSVFLAYGLPHAYYVDSHSIFRFVQGRDSVWRTHHRLTDEATPQWKQVLDDCHVRLSYALSPQAKGKVERPYGWIQDRVVRTCVRENVTDIRHGQRILDREIDRYNCHQIHSTTLEIPYLRFQKALNENQSLFRPFQIPPPFLSAKDVFCLRLERTVDAYRTISLNTLRLKLKGANPYDIVSLRISPLQHGIAAIHIWHDGNRVDVLKVKNSDLKGVHF